MTLLVYAEQKSIKLNEHIHKQQFHIQYIYRNIIANGKFDFDDLRITLSILNHFFDKYKCKSILDILISINPFL